ncbi:reverse transcriptase N-terminal domain-containing protein [Candidatus Tisiphia endosymbiont of Metellina segmentata]|uniref:reverse transcriptase N-terminal domain-containing protein n=1 Tax=Candidatus Tisiphia endosymbiont of Metellina segmentata TaxID=3066274 RepID=UPI00313B3697
MTAMATPSAGATLASMPNWEIINWSTIKVQVRRLQFRIAKAFREGKHNKVKALQWILTQ